MATATEAHRYALMGRPEQFGQMPASGVAWALVFAVLQVLSVCVIAAGLRARWRMEARAAFAVGGVSVMVADALGMFGMLVWLRLTVGVT